MEGGMTVSSENFHKLLHCYEKVVDALSDYYHFYQNSDGVVTSVADLSLVNDALESIRSTSVIVQSQFKSLSSVCFNSRKSVQISVHEKTSKTMKNCIGLRSFSRAK